MRRFVGWMVCGVVVSSMLLVLASCTKKEGIEEAPAPPGAKTMDKAAGAGGAAGGETADAKTLPQPGK